MSAIYTSPWLLFLLIRFVWAGLILLSGMMAYSGRDGEYLIMSVGLTGVAIGVTLFCRTVRVRIFPDHVEIAGLFFRQRLRYSSLMWAAQVIMFAPKTICIRLNSPFPIGFYLYPVTPHVMLDDLLNVDVHDSVEYINSRIAACTSKSSDNASRGSA